MSSWYSQMVKSQETARERNKREQRRLQLELDQKHGPEFAAKYRVKELNREQRIVSKELERIRKGVHKPLANEYTASTPAEKRAPFSISAVTYSREETTLYKAMLFLQNNPSALIPIVDAHSQSRAYLETLQRISPSLTPEPRKFVPKYLKSVRGDEHSYGVSHQMSKYSTLLYRQSPILRKNSPLMQRKSPALIRNSPTHDGLKQSHSPHGPSPLTEVHNTGTHDKNVNPTEMKSKVSASNEIIQETGNVRLASESQTERENLKDSELFLDLGDQKIEYGGDSSFHLSTRSSEIASVRLFKTEVISTSTPTSGRPRQPLDLLTLADNGIQSARDNIAQRLSGRDMTTYNKPGVQRKTSVAENESGDNTAEDKSKIITATKAVSMFPAYDPEVYNADGSKRTVHQLPDFDESYQQARKARYIRSKENLEKERELAIKDIFDKDTK